MSCVGTSLTKEMGTDSGTVICHICFPCRFEGASISETLDAGWKDIDVGSKPAGEL